VTVRRVAVLLALALCLSAPTAALGAPRERTSLSDLEDEVMCVTCRIPLQLADSPEANRERVFIRAQIAKGDTKDQVKQALVAQYGERVLAEPKDSGVDLVAWIVPGLAILLALAALIFAVPRWRGRRDNGAAAEPAPAGPALSAAETRRLDDELSRYGR
jgi:cytochrome c-type biogenesis protein CcmH